MTLRTLAATLVASALAAACGGGGHSARPVATPTVAAETTAVAARDGTAALEQRFVQVVARVSPAVVQIETPDGLGSGVIYDARGDVVTNNHVVGNHQTFTVTFANGRRQEATLVGSFAPDDLAVIRLKGSAPAPATFGDSAKLAVGQIAFAIGNPLGLRSSVTQGIVSSLGRTVPEGNGAVISSAIQTSAPINPGNSGGALVDLAGQVIGIPTLAALDPELGGSAAPGIGFAIPSSTVKRIAAQLIATGHVTSSDRSYLGVSVASTVGGAGVLISAVLPGGPAAKAGLRPGEVITAVDGQPTPTSDALATLLAAHRPGSRVSVQVLDRDGARRTASVTLGQQPG